MLIALLLLLGVSSFEASLREGLTALQRNDLTGARASLEHAAQLEPGNAKVWIALAQTYWKLNESAEAEEAAEKAARLGPNDVAVLQTLAIYHSETNRPLRTAADYQAAIRVDPTVERYYFEAARAFFVKERFADAIGVLRAGKARFRNSPQIELALGVGFYGLRRFPEAASAFLATIALAPDVEQPYLFLGKMLDQIPDRLPEVTERFVEFEKTNPENYAGYLLHAKALNAQSKDPEAAERLLQKAIALNENDASGHFELGALLDRMRRYAEAAKQFERAAALDSHDAAAHYRLSRIYDRLGRHEDAKRQRDLHAQLAAEQDKAR